MNYVRDVSTTDFDPTDLTFDPTDLAFQLNPYPLLAELRRHDPLHITPVGVQMITRHADVLPLLKARASSGNLPLQTNSERGLYGPTMQAFARAIVHREPPDHTKLRQIMAEPFNASSVQSLRQAIGELTDDLLDTALKSGRTFDFMADVAAPLPYLVNYLILGIPPEMHSTMAAWLHDVEGASSPMPSAQAVERSDAAVKELRDYLGTLVSAPSDSPGLLQRMFAHRHSSDFDHDDLLDNAVLLFSAGAETVSALMVNMIDLLCTWDGDRDALSEEEGIRKFVVEALRFESPISTSYRWMSEDVEVPSGLVKANTPVYLSIASANRDPSAFHEPDVFDPFGDRTANVAFGLGRHLCLGARIAQAQGEVVLDRMLRRFRNIKVVETPERLPSMELRTFKTLNIEVECQS